MAQVEILAAAHFYNEGPRGDRGGAPSNDKVWGIAKVGTTMVLMEYAKGVVETVKVEEIEDGLVYGTAEDGEPLCAPLVNCDKVPF